MTAQADHAASDVVSRQAQINVWLLAICQALFFTGVMVTAATSSLVGIVLAADPVNATLPLAFQTASSLATTLPASFLMAKIGRRAGFTIGIGVGVISVLGGAAAIMAGDFVLFCLSAAGIGVHQGFAIYYRFAATDIAPTAYKPKAVSYVLGGGVLAAFLGPLLATETKDLLAPIEFAGCYLAIALLWTIPLFLMQKLRIPVPTKVAGASGGRPLLEIARQPAFLVAILGAVFGYASMNFMMTATPLAMQVCGFDFDSTAAVIQIHVVGMFAPSFITGHLIRKFGVLRIMAVGAVLELFAAGTAMSGIEIENFMIALAALGIGWNFLFVGATTLITDCHTPEERAKVQGFNDFTIFGLMAISSYMSGVVHHISGWSMITMIIVPGLIITLVAVVLLGMTRGWRDPAGQAA
ncbi:MAG: MFS transporter [Alphaproteobacteria bacterium]|nr:MFS transporter [Alphaproteobacteria bacterium]